MVISNDNKSWKSNTWGYVRYDGKKFHDGLDLLGEPGVTPVYAMYSGKVVRVISGQPLRDENGDLPTNYRGDDDKAGNRITIETRLPDGRIVQVSYWHLDTKENNPYTQNLNIGDWVNAGQIIGVVGKTGNAYNKIAHLHLKTYILGTDKKTNTQNNPYQYLYTKFDPNNGTVTKDC